MTKWRIWGHYGARFFLETVCFCRTVLLTKDIVNTDRWGKDSKGSVIFG